MMVSVQSSRRGTDSVIEEDGIVISLLDVGKQLCCAIEMSCQGPVAEGVVPLLFCMCLLPHATPASAQLHTERPQLSGRICREWRRWLPWASLSGQTVSDHCL
ncbi:hypothetical protein E2C01_030181 [Portunus trituberculatus]|uniref:Uncharacterized protein n=1 Tax=Portunus trituberculatus TaxID=210409 RepID=A0A5B7ERE1_PORTR|nr:hypothetical protein [Portunus trituberculatus]